MYEYQKPVFEISAVNMNKTILLADGIGVNCKATARLVSSTAIEVGFTATSYGTTTGTLTVSATIQVVEFY